MADIDTLGRRRTSALKRVGKIQALVSAHATTPLALDAVSIYVDELKALSQKVETIHDAASNLCKDEASQDVQDSATEKVTDAIRKVNIELQEIKRSLTPSSSSSTPNNVRLPILDLPTFDGKPENWKSFEDLFLATIESNTTLKDAVKLQYLKSCVRGEATLLLKNLQVTDANYRVAWATLVDRFENEREIVTAILRRLFHQPSVPNESPKLLQQLLDTTNECFSALNVIGVPVDQSDDFLVFIVVEKMDPESKKQWAMTLKGSARPKFKELTDFLEQHIRSLLAANSNCAKSQVPQQKPFKQQGMRQATFHHASSFQCKLCNGNHAIYMCKQFQSSSTQERSNIVKKCELCFNCLKGDHKSIDCKSKSTCRKCQKKHNTLLHFEKNPTPNMRQSSSSNAPQQPSSSVSLVANPGNVQTQVLLQTALVKVQDQNGSNHVCRVLLDSASEATIITTKCARALGLKGEKTHVAINGLSSTAAGIAKERVYLRLSSCVYGTWVDIEALVLGKVTGEQPRFSFSSNWDHIRKLQLADPKYYQPGPIDILLGSDYYAMVMREGRKVGIKNSPIALHSIFGWVLSGRISSTGPSVRVHHVGCDVDATLKRFWEIEELPTVKHLTAEEENCENIFITTHTRDENGRYIVKLPFKSYEPKLGNSREAAVRRFKHVERRLGSFPEKKLQYCDFMEEFENMHHMEHINDIEPRTIPGIQPGLVPGNPRFMSDDQTYYMPHHCVLKESTTTKLRVVFDASAKSSNGISLNDLLLVGPTIQDNLYNLLLRFRTNPIALKADITKFYRQFVVHPEHQNYQRVIWRSSPDQPIKDYKMLRVTYGTACGAYLSTRCLKQLALDEKEKYPIASQIILRDFYVDDMISGASSIDEAIKIFKQMTGIFSLGGMELRKWSSNNSTVLAAIPLECKEVEEHHNFDQDNTVKALGVRWNPKTDSFIFIVSSLPSTTKITKRVVLSELAKVFDPLGFLSPVTIKIKILFQKLWRNNLDWDEELPVQIRQEWYNYYNQLRDIEKIQIPRYISANNFVSYQLHGFCDASESAYAAVIYLRSVKEDGSVMIRMITGKTKVAPVKTITLPRLELCAAVILAHLMHNVKQATQLECETYLWGDSTIVLRWLATYPDRWKTFVSNRVSDIQSLFPAEHWFHVPSEHNPADCASRGISPSELQASSLWWNGPEFLQHSSLPIFPCSVIDDSLDMEEKRKVLLSSFVCSESEVLPRFSNLNKLKRVTAYVFRFINNSKKKPRLAGHLSCSELEQSLMHWIKVAQCSEFSQDIQDLKNLGRVSNNSKLKTFAPFLDSTGILRVGGRLQKSDLGFSSRHQIILPRHHFLTTLIIENCHKTNLHAGYQLMWSILQQNYWIMRSRDTIRYIVRKCVVCKRNRAELASQLMGSLPSPRVNPGRAFLHCGVDYAGPFPMKVMKGRSTKTFKGYFCIFVCMATKAVHLEAVADLTTESFLASLKKFIARRGICSDLYSDCGTNFVGADKELQQLLESSEHNKAVAEDLSTTGITWHFNPPSSPHHGGLWEAGVKSVKFHLRRVIKNSILTFDEFQTVLCQVEACLNSRPLCAMSSDPTDLGVLTPGHFLIGEPLLAIPEPDLTSINTNRLSRWQLTQQMFQNFWCRWSSEYLSTLQQRFKWTVKRENLRVGDLVLIKDDLQPPLKWKMGRILAVHTGDDGCVRVASIKTSSGEYKRPIVKLCPLLQTETENSTP